ncbi:phage tail protein [Lactococcus lactis]|uniref:phage tail protein n=1 Tax=Lactococcus lactis TaxID=1358 RepID=UPI0018A9FEF1|nr:phage tail protein [Lactococcus lactis]
MQITIHDNQMNRVGFLSNEVPGLPSFFNDNWHRYLAEGAATFDFSVNKFKNGALQDYCQFLNDQAYISFTYEGEDFLFSVLTSEETDDVITLNTATLNLELRNEQANPLVNSSSHNIQWYFDQMQLIYNAQITIGINEVSNLTRTISYDGQESKLARLLSVIGNFDAEFEFVTDLNDDGTLKGISLNIYKANDGTSVQGVGTWRNDVTLYFGKNISDVRRTIDRTQIFNATTVTGAEGLNWNSSEWSVKNADGVEEFYKRKGSNTAFAPLSAELYPSQIKSSTGDFWIRKDFETEYKSANEMWGYALSQFKKYAYALVTYEVSAKSKLVSQAVGDGQALSIGDTVRIQDENFNAQTGGLILQARVSELEISFSNPSNNKLTFSNYVELESGISDDLEARLAQLIKESTPYRAELTTTNGVQFKNGTGTTELTAHIYFGSDTTETIADSYEWSKDGTVVAPTQTITVDASGVADKAVYSFKATIAGKVVASQSVTITNVNDGTNGRSVTNVSQKWRLTTTSTTPTQAWSDAGWLTTQPTTTASNKYLWSITRTTFNLAPLTQDVIEQKAVYGDKGGDGIPGKDGTNGKDGDPGKVVSDIEPTTRFKGLTWKYSGTTDLTASDGTVIKPNIEYYYNGIKWVINLIEANQLNVNELAAISAYLGHVYAAIVEDKQSDGSGFLLDSEKQLLRVNKTANTYNQIFSEGLTTFAKISDLPGIGNIIPGANYISAILAGNFLQFGQYSTAVDSDGVPVGGVSVGEGSISFGQTTSGSYGFTLTGDLTVAGNIKSLKDTDWIDIPPASGWGGIMRYMIAEGKFYLRLTGVTNPAVPAATARTMCTIPTTAVPLGGIRGIPILSYGEPVAELVINANGTVQFYPHNAVGTGHSLHVFVQGIPLT